VSRTDELLARYGQAFMPVYGLPPLVLDRGAGCLVWDADRRQYLDLIAGIAVSVLGHAHPAIIEAVTAQVRRIAHTSNLFAHRPEIQLAERLVALAGGDARVFFTNSGTEANEAAIKLTRRRRGASRNVIVAAENGFHGRTMGALAVTGKSSIRAPFRPFGINARFVSYGNAEMLASATGDDTAAVFLEPCQGEAGVVPAPPGYLQAAREICDRAGALLVLDEIQSGIGRTGTWFAHQREQVRPDILTVAKGLGGGLPIGACVGFGECGTALGKGDHGSTFGGNPICCAAAIAVLDTIESQGLLGNAASVGAVLTGTLTGAHPLIAEVRGIGLWLAIVLHQPVAAAAEQACREAGYLVNAVQPDAIRLAPPLILSAGQARSFAASLPGILDRVSTPELQGAR
jgi:acetylornithine/N-succinyldiaminopimelate aminotransferase